MLIQEVNTRWWCYIQNSCQILSQVVCVITQNHQKRAGNTSRDSGLMRGGGFPQRAAAQVYVSVSHLVKIQFVCCRGVFLLKRDIQYVVCEC